MSKLVKKWNTSQQTHPPILKQRRFNQIRLQFVYFTNTFAKKNLNIYLLLNKPLFIYHSDFLLQSEPNCKSVIRYYVAWEAEAGATIPEEVEEPKSITEEETIREEAGTAASLISSNSFLRVISLVPICWSCFPIVCLTETCTIPHCFKQHSRFWIEPVTIFLFNYTVKKKFYYMISKMFKL